MTVNDKFRCKICNCLWRKGESGTWSLFDTLQHPDACCDNNANFLANIEEIPADSEDTSPGLTITPGMSKASLEKSTAEAQANANTVVEGINDATQKTGDLNNQHPEE